MRNLPGKLWPLALIAFLAFSTLLIIPRFQQKPSSASSLRASHEAISAELTAELARIEAREHGAAQTVWAKEMLAQECGRTFEALWDSLNVATNKFDLVASFPFAELLLGDWSNPQILPHNIEVRQGTGAMRRLGPKEWRQMIQGFERGGWRLAQTEFRHSRFETDPEGEPRQSRFYFSAHLTNSAHPDRASLEGDLVVDWAGKPANGEPASVKRIDASHLSVTSRSGSTPFQQTLFEQIKSPENAYSIDPLIVYDLDGDGLSEVVLAAKNLVYRRTSDGRGYESHPLCRHPPGLISTALIADFDGDGNADFLVQKHEGLVLLRGSREDEFKEPGRLVWPAPADLKYPMVLACGDIDRDGDLDLFLAQYKVPYELGSMPTPFYDANDGNPAYLLLNDANGNFRDATRSAGFTQKRTRRTYSASFADLDGNGDLDLVVVSDFAGVDLYRNDGQGHFTDVTRDWVDIPQAFGMAHALADFNRDGRVDLLMIGMTSPTADRLEHLGLWRPGAGDDRTMRAKMTFGNRLFLARSNGGFEQTALSSSIARSGWSWGCTAFDFDNDGFPDVYVGNGLESRQSVRDYESEYWLHDAFVGSSNEESAAYLYFKSKFTRTRGRGQSYGGYEKNRLYLNQRGENFFEAAHLLGVALEQDSRNVVADDLDGDGSVDLLVTSFEAWPEAKQTVRIFKNNLTERGNWIGFQLREEGNGNSPVGAKVTLHHAGGSTLRQIVTGDSYRSQHSTTLHFGLGKVDKVDVVEVRWVNGKVLTLRTPAINQYYRIHPP